MNRVAVGLLVGLMALFALASGMQMGRAAEECTASVYGSESGSRRADNRPFRPAELGCAHRTRPLGSSVTVTDLRTGRSIRCPINDRGPYVAGRCLDLSFGAARALGVRGLARVRVD